MHVVYYIIFFSDVSNRQKRSMVVAVVVMAHEIYG
jgi:hypothetical protein